MNQDEKPEWLKRLQDEYQRLQEEEGTERIL